MRISQHFVCFFYREKFFGINGNNLPFLAEIIEIYAFQNFLIFGDKF
jgi:hypothetical protein